MIGPVEVLVQIGAAQTAAQDAQDDVLVTGGHVGHVVVANVAATVESHCLHVLLPRGSG
jgi:hypothetical protein